MESKNGFNVKFGNDDYDIKKFMRDHPGGVKTLEYYQGKSVVDAMAKFEHSSSAYHLLKEFKIDKRNGVVKELVGLNLTGGVSGNGRIITKEDTMRDLEEIAFLEELEGRLDWSKPLLSQLEKVVPHYIQWVNSPVYRQTRVFASPVLERMTYTPWYVVPAFWLPIILYFGTTEYVEHVLCTDRCSDSSLTTLGYLINLIAGVFLWTIVEYIAHRWMFHMDPGQSLTMIKIHYLMHGIHHKTPFDSLRQVGPLVQTVPIALLFYSILRLIFIHSLILISGILFGYVCYDMIHYYFHHGSPVDGTYMYTMKRYHSNHHFLNHDKAYGVTSKIWDYVFMTLVQIRNLGFSLQW